MTKEKLFEAIGDIKEEHILDAKAPKEKKTFNWVTTYAVAACLCIVLGVASFSIPFWDYPGFSGGSNGGGNNGDGPTDSILLTSHREDFSSIIDSEILSQFENHDTLLKIYWLLDNHWFLSTKLEDFSQAVTTEVRYIYPGDMNQQNPNGAYSTYMINEAGNLEWLGMASYSYDVSSPVGLAGLSHEKIRTDLAGIEYEDYIVTYSNRLHIVFVWVYSPTEDLILTYPVRPEFTGLEVGRIYTLEEIQEILKDADNK